MQIFALLILAASLSQAQVLSIPSKLSADCQESLNKLLKDKNTLVKAKMIDAWGKPAGILEGAFTAMGDFDECLGINEIQSDFQFNYVLVTGKLNMTRLGVSIPSEWGLCVPVGCQSVADISGLIHMLPKVLPFEYEVFEVHPAHKSPWLLGDFVYLCCVGVFVLAVLLSTLKDYSEKSPLFKKKPIQQQPATKRWTSEAIVSGSEETKPLTLDMIDDEDQIEPVEMSQPKKPALWEKILKCFSLYSTLDILFTVNSGGKFRELACLNVVRTISIWWVVLGHTCSIFVEKVPIDVLLFLNYLKRPDSILIVNAFLSVDTFFFLTGFLVAYMIFSDSKSFSKFSYLKYTMLRYLRLTPSYVIVLFFWALIFPKLGYGPAWYIKQDMNPEKCRKYWWSHILYVNNLVPPLLDDSCASWTWYLAVDFQLYLIAPIYIFLLQFSRTRLFAYGLTFVSIIVSSIVIILTSISNNLPVIATPIADKLSLTDRSEHSRWLETFYEKPWSHLTVMLFGILTAHFAIMMRERLASARQSTLSFRFVTACQLVGTALMLTTLYLPFDFIKDLTRWSIETNAIYNCLSRIGWSLGLGLFFFPSIVSPESTHLLTKFWTWTGWSVYAKITYGVYLIHIPVIQIFFSNKMREIPYKPSEIVMMFGGVLWWSSIVAGITFVLIEAPMGSLIKLIGK